RDQGSCRHRRRLRFDDFSAERAPAARAARCVGAHRLTACRARDVGADEDVVGDGDAILFGRIVLRVRILRGAARRTEAVRDGEELLLTAVLAVPERLVDGDFFLAHAPRCYANATWRSATTGRFPRAFASSAVQASKTWTPAASSAAQSAPSAPASSSAST